jgi:hypothetical protein
LAGVEVDRGVTQSSACEQYSRGKRSSTLAGKAMRSRIATTTSSSWSRAGSENTTVVVPSGKALQSARLMAWR